LAFVAERRLETLMGWGRTAPSAAWVRRAGRDADLGAVLNRAGPRGVIARGLGRSYGDAAQNAGGEVIDTTGLESSPALDEAGATARVSAGTSLDSLLRSIVPAGFFVPVTPGTRDVTIGGAIAADIHGKNHHAVGSIAQHVDRLTLQTPSGTFELTPTDDPELFWATAGGMGLTGVITEATLRLRRIETSVMLVETERAVDVDDVMSRMVDADARHHYSVAWIDCLARGRDLGRAVLTCADHATVDDLTGRWTRRPRRYGPRTPIGAPRWVPSNLLNPMTVRAFNEMWFRRAPKCRTVGLESIESYFYPLDAVHNWNRLYGPAGLRQYQYVVPDSEAATVRATLECISEAGLASFLAVLKRFGPQRGGPLAFPMPGWTLAFDVAASSPGLEPLLQQLDRLILDAGGRVYLAKDSRLPAGVLADMYPDLDRFREVRTRVDPNGRLQSDLGRRLQLL
jgi:decaprenylphospho-beta-D-ribofuranose 2-oxidase